MKTTDARREEEGGQGRVCLSLCVCVGQCPTVSLRAPSHVFMLMASVQAASWPWKTALQPWLQAHSLTQAATPHTYTLPTPTHNPPPPSHLHSTAPSHTCSSLLGPCTLMYLHPLHTHPLCKTRWSHIPVTYTSAHTYVIHTHTLHAPSIALSHPYPTGDHLFLTHTMTDTCCVEPVHMCTCLYVHTFTLTNSQIAFTALNPPANP